MNADELTVETVPQDPVRTALVTILHSANVEPPPRAHFYGDLVDFRALWDFEKLAASAAAIIILWDGSALKFLNESGDADSGSMSAHLTPYHWAMTFRRWLVSRSADVAHRGNTKPSVFLIEMLLSRRRGSEFADRFRALSPAMPQDLKQWLTVVELGNADSVTTLPNELITWAKAIAKQPTDPTDFPPWAADLLRLSMVGTADGQHSLANVVGPILLAESLLGDAGKVVKEDAQRNALLLLLRVFGWAPKASGASLGHRSRDLVLNSKSELRKCDPLGSLEHIRFWLVDDQARRGYADVLAEALSASLWNGESRAGQPISSASVARPHSLTWCTSAQTLLSKLQTQNGDGPWCLLQGVDILLLDLRLWLGHISQGKSHLTAVLEAAQRLLPLLGTSPQLDASITAAQECLEQAAKGLPVERTAELGALTLLPLLLSRYDPSLPIIIFSSTRQREVIQRLGHLPNIHCEFTKPSVGGETNLTSSPLPDDPIERAFRDALHAAVDQLKLRPIWQRIVQLDWTLLPPRLPSTLRIYSRKKIYTEWDAEWKLTEQATKSRLANLYRSLANTEISHILSGCWELIEAGYSTPEQKVNNYKVEVALEYDENCLLSSHTEGPLIRFTMLAWALKNIRNRKAHGEYLHADPDHFEGEAIRFACSAMLVALIDFIEQRQDFKLAATPRPRGYPRDELFVRGRPPWDYKVTAMNSSTDAAYMMSQLISTLDTAFYGGYEAFLRLPPRSVTSFASNDLAKLCEAFLSGKIPVDPSPA